MKLGEYSIKATVEIDISLALTRYQFTPGAPVVPPLVPGLRNGLIAGYECNETSGTNVADVTGQGRNLTAAAAITTTADGKVGATSFAWTGTNGTAQRTDAAFLPGNQLTIAKWIKLGNTSGNQTYAGVGTNGLVGAEPWRLRKDSGANRYQFQIRGGGTTVVGGRTAQGSLVPNTTDWVFLVGGYNRDTSTVWLSENGGAKVVTSVSPSDYWPVRQDYTTFHLGSMNGTDWGRSLENECYIWNRELSAAEITQLYNAGNGLPYSEFDGYLGDWPVTPPVINWDIVGTTIMRDGEPFFPCGWYYDSDYSGYGESELIELAGSGANFLYVAGTAITTPCINKAAELNMAVMLETFNSSVIAQYKDTPHVFGYYTYDDFNNHTFAEVKARSDAAKLIAPYKLTYGSGVAASLGVTYSGACDVIAVQNYPVGNDFTADYQSTDSSWLEFMPMIAPGANAAGQCWFVNPQGFSWRGPPEVLYPTVSQMRNMHWQPILLGCKGLIYYAAYSGIDAYVSEADPGTHQHPNEIPGFMEEFELLAAETETLKNYICLGTRTVLTTSNARYAATSWSHAGKLMVIVINWWPIGSGHNGSVTVTLPAGLTNKTAPIARYGDGFTYSATSLSGTLNEEQVKIFLFDIP